MQANDDPQLIWVDARKVNPKYPKDSFQSPESETNLTLRLLRQIAARVVGNGPNGCAFNNFLEKLIRAGIFSIEIGENRSPANLLDSARRLKKGNRQTCILKCDKREYSWKNSC